MTREEFILDYCQRGNMTRAQYDTEFMAFPCDCDYGYDGCSGWVALRIVGAGLPQPVGGKPDLSEIEPGLKEISEGKVIPLSQLEA